MYEPYYKEALKHAQKEYRIAFSREPRPVCPCWTILYRLKSPRQERI